MATNAVTADWKSIEDQKTETSAMNESAPVLASEASSGQTAASAEQILSFQPPKTSSSHSNTPFSLASSFTVKPESSASMGNFSSQSFDPKTSQSIEGATGVGAVSSNAANPPSINDSTVNVGALVGGIVGAFSGGVILALIIAYVFNRRRNSQHYRSPTSKAIEPFRGASATTSPGPPTMTNAWETLIPQPIDDETMRSIVKSLLDRVTLHVDNFYARKSQIAPTDLENLAKVDSKLLPNPLPDLMVDSNMQLLAIKHCITFTLTNSIVPGNDPSDKILPIYLAALPRGFVRDLDSETDTRAFREAYAVWKTLTPCLLPKLSDEPVLVEHRRKVIGTIIDNISGAFRGWEATSDDGPLAEQNLRQIIGVAFDVGMRIASQPFVFDFQWQQPVCQGKEGTESFVVLPGFNKLVDEHGYVVGGPQVLVRPTVYRSRRDRKTSHHVQA